MDWLSFSWIFSLFMAPPKGKWNIALTQLTIELISQFTVIYLKSESKLTITFFFSNLPIS